MVEVKRLMFPKITPATRARIATTNIMGMFLLPVEMVTEAINAYHSAHKEVLRIVP